MKAPFSLFLALRYLKPKRTFVSVITVISVLGVTLGITVLIVVISVMTGFDRSLQSAILGFEPHIKVTSGEIMRNWREILPKVNSVPGVLATAPYVQGPVLIEHEGRVHPAMMRGIDPALEEKIIPLKSGAGAEQVGQQRRAIIVTGSLEMATDTVILGKALADDLGASIGDEITIIAPGNMGALVDEMKRESDHPDAKPKTLQDLKNDFVIPQPLKVAGIFDSGMNSFDSEFVLTPLTNAQELYGIAKDDGIHGISVKTTDVNAVGETKLKINHALDGDAYASSWYDENRMRFDAVRVEKRVMFIILMFLVVIAAFGVANTLITVTVQKTREIGIMKALGATPAQIVWVFLFQGMFVGFFGNLTGLITGLTMLHYRNPFRDWLSTTFGWDLFPAGIYEFEGIPAVVVPSEVAIICVSAFIICSVAALIPAYIASQLDPVKALRYE